MAEAAIKAVTEVIVADKQPAPVIRHEPDGSLTGHVEYARALIPPGQVMTAELKANGVTVATLGPVTASVLAGKNFIAEVRLKARDDCGVSDFERAVLEPKPI